jgi:hypothetical protein
MGEIVRETLSWKNSSHTQKIGLVEWLKVKALSSSPSTVKTNNNKKTKTKNKYPNQTKPKQCPP